MSKRVVAIHQPNFFPWLGYFAKIDQADVFIVLDTVDYPKSGKSMGSFTNRVKLNINGAAKWWGCPVVRESGAQPIAEVLIREESWTVKALKTLAQSYAKARFFADIVDDVREMVEAQEVSICQYNVQNLRRVCDVLGITTEFVMQSELVAAGASTEMLVNLVRAVDGDIYLSGTGAAKSYQDETVFEQAGIELKINPFTPMPYEQGLTGEFMPGLSVLDSLFHCGVDGTLANIRAKDLEGA